MARLIKAHGDNEPSIMTVQFNEDNIPVYAAINLNITKTDNGFVWDELVLPDFALENIHNAPYEIKQNVLISHIIKAYYDDNHMFAIQNNYLAEPEDPDYRSEFLAMQNIRKIAKHTAKHIVINGLF